MEISTMNNGDNTITLEVEHGVYILAEQLTADRYRVSLHSHYSQNFAVHSWWKPWLQKDANGNPYVEGEELLGGMPFAYIVNADGLFMARTRARFVVKRMKVKGELPASLSERFAIEYDQAVSVS